MLPVSAIEECIAELLTYEEAFGDCTVSEVIAIIQGEMEKQEELKGETGRLPQRKERVSQSSQAGLLEKNGKSEGRCDFRPSPTLYTEGMSQ